MTVNHTPAGGDPGYLMKSRIQTIFQVCNKVQKQLPGYHVTMDELTRDMEQLDVKPKRRYKCRTCGLPKKGHICHGSFLENPTNLLDLDEDCLKLIGEMVKEHNQQTQEKWKEDCNLLGKCFVCENYHKDSDSSRSNDSSDVDEIFCDMCEYMCCYNCHTWQPHMFMTEEELEEYEKRRSLPDYNGTFSSYDVCTWCEDEYKGPEPNWEKIMEAVEASAK